MFYILKFEPGCNTKLRSVDLDESSGRACTKQRRCLLLTLNAAFLAVLYYDINDL